jgi:hypothetical protein
MMPGALPLLLGLLLGLRHAFEPDHLAAVAALMGRSSRGAGRIGAWWGAGHAAALLSAGTAVILLGWRVPREVEALLELAVASILLVLGGRILAHHLKRDRAHLHLHEHDGIVHAHLHYHDHAEREHAQHAHPHPLQRWLMPARRPFLVGFVHGLSGTGAATLLVLAASPSTAAALLALALFASGTLIGMAALSWILSLPVSAARKGSSILYRTLQLGSGTASLVVGLLLAIHTLGSMGWP